MIDIVDKAKCCGCGACFNICPRQCISMEQDEEGFLYPIVELESCINCKLCEKACPVIGVTPDVPFHQEAYIVQNKNNEIRRESTSGGAFTSIAEYVLDCGGVVFGVAYDEAFHVHHTCVETKDELFRFRNSKYVQSDMGDCMSQAKIYLNQGRMVCFSGTPCQIEGLKRYLGKDYDNLLTIDVVCHAVPSPLVWKRYLEVQQDKYGNKIGNIRFRDKYYGYKYSTMTVEDKKGRALYAFGIDTDPMLRAFFSNICDRPSCYECGFKKRYRESDFTIWDCYPVNEFNKRLDDDKGTTRLLIHTDKGRAILKAIEKGLRLSKTTPDQLTAGVKEMFRSVPMNAKRSAFMADVAVMDGQALFDKWFPETAKVKIVRCLKMLLLRLRVYAFTKRVVGKIKRWRQGNY